MSQQPGEQNGKICTEWDRLFTDFEAAIAEIIAIQFESVVVVQEPKNDFTSEGRRKKSARPRTHCCRTWKLICAGERAKYKLR